MPSADSAKALFSAARTPSNSTAGVPVVVPDANDVVTALQNAKAAGDSRIGSVRIRHVEAEKARHIRPAGLGVEHHDHRIANPDFRMAVPITDHFVPLLYIVLHLVYRLPPMLYQGLPLIVLAFVIALALRIAAAKLSLRHVDCETGEEWNP